MLDIPEVRQQVRRAIERARLDAVSRRERAEAADRQGRRFVEHVAAPVAQQVMSVLRAEGFGFRLSTPPGAVRLVSDRRREDFIDIAVDTAGDEVAIMTTVSHVRGGRVLVPERPLNAEVEMDALTERHVLEFLLHAIQVFVER